MFGAVGKCFCLRAQDARVGFVPVEGAGVVVPEGVAVAEGRGLYLVLDFVVRGAAHVGWWLGEGTARV